MKPKKDKGELIIFRTKEGEPGIQVRFEQDTVWLSQKLMGQLFQKDSDTIGLHLKNIYAQGELDESATTEDYSVVQKEGKRQVSRNVSYYNLDAIISVGYRVNSKRGTQFRIWATRILRDHLVKGYTINEKRLRELRQTVRLIAGVAERHPLTSDEAAAVLRVVSDYTFALDLLDDFDHQRLTVAETTKGQAKPVTYAEARKFIAKLKERFTAPDLFGREKDSSLHSSLQTVFQTFEGKDLYPGLEEKAAHLLYFLVKNHSFIDGNKRIAASLFLWFLEKNRMLYKPDGSKRIGDNALVAMTLLIAESKPSEKKLLTNVVTNLLTYQDA